MATVEKLRKAVKITEANQQELIGRYGADMYDLDQFPVGYWLVTDFGDNGEYRYDGVLLEADLDAKYTRTKTLLNGFIEIKRRPT
jgi:hypothetical protein